MSNEDRIVLFCKIGDHLKTKRAIISDVGAILENKDEYCKVVDIVGYGIDMVTKSNIEFRIMNSLMSEYFYSNDEIRDDKINEILK